MASRLLIGALIELLAAFGAVAWFMVRVRGVPRFRWGRALAILAPLFVWPAIVRRLGLRGFAAYGGLLDASMIVALAIVAVAAPLELVRWVRRRRQRARVSPASDVIAPPPSIDAPSRRDALSSIGGGLAAAAAAVPMAHGFLRTRFDVEHVEVPIRIARLPKALDGFRIVQVSDVHVGAWLGERQLRHAEEIVAGLRPDLFVLTGDLLQRELDVLPLAVASMARMASRARFGGAAITGNHEYYAGARAVMSALQSASIRSLVNEAALIAPGDGGGFGLVGVDDLQGSLSGEGPGPRPERALASLPPDAARILLCHQPQWLPAASGHGFDLMLSGHTHGGQIAPAGALVGRWIFGHVAGWARYGDTQLYVNRGLGTSGPPTRVWVRPEITSIVLVAG
jgi:predicted MPP superfamily phosphohydrolase